MLRAFTLAKIRYLGARSAPRPAPKVLERVPNPRKGGGGQGLYKPHFTMASFQ